MGDLSSDLEKAVSFEGKTENTEAEKKSISKRHFWLHRLVDKRAWAHYALLEWSNIDPISVEKQNQKNPFSIGAVWFSANMNILSFSTGMLVADMGFGLRDAMYTILGFMFLFSFPPAFFTTFGSKLGTRQMVHARYSFGYFGASIISLLNVLTFLGYTILNSILAGESLQAVSPHMSMSATVGIVIVCVIALVVSFCGIRVLNMVEKALFLPVVISFAILAGEAKSGPNGLHTVPNEAPPSARSILGLGCILAGFQVSWAGCGSDVSMYLSRNVSSWYLFVVMLFSYMMSPMPIMMLGAAFATSAKSIPRWNDAVQANSSPGPLINLVLSSHLGNFGKFLTVVLGLSAVGNMITSMYSLGLSLQTAIPKATVLPRFFVPIVAMAIVLPLAIVGQNSFYDTLSDFVSIIAYWASLFVGVVFADHAVIRRCRFSSYDMSIWNNWRELPPGIAALSSAILPLGLIVPFMDQEWYTGPLAKHVGDLGFEIGIALSCVLYVVLRPVEKRIFAR